MKQLNRNGFLMVIEVGAVINEVGKFMPTTGIINESVDEAVHGKRHHVDLIRGVKSRYVNIWT
jgi:hypothetical protein